MNTVPKNLIFDFDGTIADSFKLNVDIFCKITGRREKTTTAQIERLRQMQTHQVLRELDVSLWQIPRLLREWRTAMRQRIGEVRPFPEIGGVLQKLHTRGYKLYLVSTNSPQNIDAFLTKYQLRQFFVEIYGDVGLFGKRRTLRRILRQQSLSARDCFYIGDETRDVKAGNRAGIRTIAVGWGYTGEKAFEVVKPYLLIRQPAELMTVCDNLQK